MVKKSSTTRGRPRKSDVESGGTMSAVMSGKIKKSEKKEEIKVEKPEKEKVEKTSPKVEPVSPKVEPVKQIIPVAVPAKPKPNVVMIEDLETRQRVSIGRYDFRFIKGRVRPIPANFLETFKSMNLVKEVEK